jgi:hypothetical protein
MNNQPIHILNKMGVLTNFSIALRVTDQYISDYFKKQKKTGRTKAETEKLFIQKVEKDITNAMQNYTIPGLLKDEGQFDNKNTSNLPENVVSNLPTINKLIVGIAHKIMNLNFDKMTLCYIVNSLVNLLNLTEEDFEKFHGLDNGEDEGEGENFE